MLKIRETATPLKKDGGRDLGGLVGAIIGAGLAYWGLASATHSPFGAVIVLTVSAGALLGVVIGSAIGAMIDIRLTSSKHNKTSDEKPLDRRRMH